MTCETAVLSNQISFQWSSHLWFLYLYFSFNQRSKARKVKFKTLKTVRECYENKPSPVSKECRSSDRLSAQPPCRHWPELLRGGPTLVSGATMAREHRPVPQEKGGMLPSNLSDAGFPVGTESGEGFWERIFFVLGREIPGWRIQQ